MVLAVRKLRSCIVVCPLSLSEHVLSGSSYLGFYFMTSCFKRLSLAFNFISRNGFV